MVDKFNTVWSSLVELPRCLTLDEMMIKLCMHLEILRRQPDKPIRDGIQEAPPLSPPPAPPNEVEIDLHTPSIPRAGDVLYNQP